MSNRLEKYLSCPHRNVQQYTEVCLDCGENIYTTESQIRQEESKTTRRKQDQENWDKDDTGW
jgi:hypothetical protein